MAEQRVENLQESPLFIRQSYRIHALPLDSY